MLPLNAILVVGTREIWDALQPSMEQVRILFEQSEIGEWGPFLEKIDRMVPDLVLIDLAAIREPLADVVSRLRNTPAHPAVFVLNKTAEPDAILQALRAGANEFLYPPFTDSVMPALERVAADRDRIRTALRQGGRTVGFVSAKGGCGATTIACHVASELAHAANHKVLLADLDLQSGLISFLLKSKSEYSVSDAAANLHRMDASYWRALVSNGIPNLELIAAPGSPSSKNVPADKLRHMLAFTRTQYDWVVADLGRNVDAHLLTVLEQVDQTFIVTTFDVPALHHAKAVVQTLIETGYRRDNLRVLLNRTPKRTDITRDEIASMLGVPVAAAIPDDFSTVNEAYADGQLISRSTALGQHYTRIARSIAGIGDQPKRRFSLFR